MKQAGQHRANILGVPLCRIALSALAAGGVSASVVTVSNAGAVTERAAKSVVVSTVNNAVYGKILVSRKTVYTVKSNKTGCNAQCLKIWPELVLPKGVTRAKAGPGVTARKLGTVKRKGGKLQVTYSGKPLYFFVGDTVTGQVNGNISDLWGKWSVVVASPPAHAAAPITTSPTSPTSTPTTAAGSGTQSKSTTPTTTRTQTTTAPPATTPPTSPPVTTTPPTSPPTTTTPTTSPPTTTTTTAPGGGGIGF
jgi:predicted lipoprotein with Yx(FWY)xxD motif